MARAALAKSAPAREIVDVDEASSGLAYVGFAARRLRAGEKIEGRDDARESCLVVLTGRVDIRAGDVDARDIGDRASVFDDRSPYAVYVPPRTTWTIVAHTDAEIGIGTAPATGTLPARLIEPATMKRSVRGRDANTRYVCDILPQTEPAESLLVVEVLTPSGHSSSYPPHKHDTDALPGESFLEETYYHRVDPPQGFVFQRVYTDDRSEDASFAVEDHDVVIVPRGYHPVCVPYGYRSYYLNVMAGPKRIWSFRNDPQHEWMLAK
ncbi:MAG: 5-deoxy-glucuronate isomerase [Proteobacteria bacterium]|nr:5-deoxy-glucuronate isomerase [Pseudomonadota bacterium]